MDVIAINIISIPSLVVKIPVNKKSIDFFPSSSLSLSVEQKK